MKDKRVLEKTHLYQNRDLFIYFSLESFISLLLQSGLLGYKDNCS